MKVGIYFLVEKELRIIEGFEEQTMEHVIKHTLSLSSVYKNVFDPNDKTQVNQQRKIIGKLLEVNHPAYMISWARKEFQRFRKYLFVFLIDSIVVSTFILENNFITPFEIFLMGWFLLIFLTGLSWHNMNSEVPKIKESLIKEFNPTRLLEDVENE
jgi:hypothetical protein